MCFSFFYPSKYHNQSLPHFSVICLMTCAFSYSHLFLVSTFYHLASEKIIMQVHNGDLTHFRQTLQLIKFYLIKNMTGNGGNKLAQFNFPLFNLSIMWSFFNHMVKFTVSLILISSIHFFCLLSKQSEILLPTNVRSI